MNFLTSKKGRQSQFCLQKNIYQIYWRTNRALIVKNLDYIWFLISFILLVVVPHLLLLRLHTVACSHLYIYLFFDIFSNARVLFYLSYMIILFTSLKEDTKL